MLKGLDRAITADLLMVLMSMGHGDDLLICDVNHPAATIAKHTAHGRLVDMAGCDLPRAAEAILSLMPLDTFVPEPVIRMKSSTTPSASCRYTDACKTSSTGLKAAQWPSRPSNASTSTPRPNTPSRLSEPRTPDHTAASSYARASFDPLRRW